MSDKICCGLLGTGHAHAVGKLRVLQESSDFELVGVCEPDATWRAQREGEDAFKTIRWLTELELLDDTTVQMVAVESAVQDNLPLARKAVEAGKHIHLDKPPGTSLTDLKTLLDEANRQELIVQMGYMFRYNPGFEFVLKAAREGWLGEVYYVHGNISSDIRGDSRVKLAFHPGGMMFELACHLIDIFVLLLGRPQTVTPHLRHDASQDDEFTDNTLAVFEYERAMAVIESSAMEANAFARRQLEVCGTMGSVVLQPLEPPALRLNLREPRDDYQAGWQTVSVPNIPRYVRDFEDLARCIRGEQAFPYSTEHDFTTQETLLRACGMLDNDGNA